MSVFKGVVVLTKEQYDALETKDEDTMYLISDKTVPVATISDSGKTLIVNASGELGYGHDATKQDKLTAGSNVTISGTTISATNTTYTTATTSNNGLMSSSDKTKLNGIATGAQVNAVTDVKVNGTSVVSNKIAEITGTVPSSTVSDAGKFLRVNSAGAAAWETVPDANGEDF